MQSPDLGTVRGREALGLAESSFYPVTDADGNVTYYYFNDSIVSVTMLSGAGLNTVGETAKLRFDNAIPVSVYNALAATYGAHRVAHLLSPRWRVQAFRTRKLSAERCTAPMNLR